MGVYINMEMPKEGFIEILIRGDGTVQQTGQSYRIDGTDYYTPYVGEMPAIYKAVPVPPHGDLIERIFAVKALKPANEMMETEADETWGMIWADECNSLDLVPTIIPAEEGET